METYRCKRYRRARPGAMHGVITDTMTFTADSPAEAEEMVRRGFVSGWAPMDWNTSFATLENATGAILEVWESADIREGEPSA